MAQKDTHVTARIESWLEGEVIQPMDDFKDPKQEWRRLFSELFGTFFLVLVAAGGGMMGQAFPDTISRTAAVVAPGLMVMAIILFMGKVSGAHLNPAVSIAFALRRDFPWPRVPGYIVVQLAGAARRGVAGGRGRGGRTGQGMSERSSLRTRAVKSAAWYGATRLWGQLISWAVTVLLARLLAPEDYGLYAIALSVLAMVELLQEFGLGTALIQRQDLTRAQVSAVFWVVASTSLLLTGLTMVAAGAISRIYGEPGLAWPLRLLCLTFLLNSLGTVPYSLLTKNINLRRRSLAEAFGVTASALVALSLAYLGFGVVALVVGHLARAVVLNVGLAFFAGWAPTLEVDFRGMRKLLSFGMSVAGSQLVATFTTTTNTFVIARLLSSTAVGLFSMAQGLTEAPTRLSTAGRGADRRPGCRPRSSTRSPCPCSPSSSTIESSSPNTS